MTARLNGSFGILYDAADGVFFAAAPTLDDELDSDEVDDFERSGGGGDFER